MHPPFRSKEDAELKIRRARILEVGMRSARGLGGGTEFEQLREYGPDDEFRRIDWTATARTGRHDRADLPGGAQPERAGAAGQRAHDGRPGRRCAAGRALDGRRDDADHRRHTAR